jgi:hypothetical protein
LVFFPLNKEIHSDFAETFSFGAAVVVGSGVVPSRVPPNKTETKSDVIMVLFFKE